MNEADPAVLGDNILTMLNSTFRQNIRKDSAQL
jgi:hypothetical protein